MAVPASRRKLARSGSHLRFRSGLAARAAAVSGEELPAPSPANTYFVIFTETGSLPGNVSSIA